MTAVEWKYIIAAGNVISRIRDTISKLVPLFLKDSKEAGKICILSVHSKRFRTRKKNNKRLFKLFNKWVKKMLGLTVEQLIERGGIY